MAVETRLHVNCGVCKTAISYGMPEMLGASVRIICDHCGSGMTALNTKEGVKYQAFKVVDFSGKFLDLVMANIPPKPWPQGMSKEIAKKMGVSNKPIDRAIGALIKAGRLEPSIPQIAALPAASANSTNGETQKVEAGTPS